MRTLLATGLFKSVRPMCVPPTIREAPAFRVVPSPDGSGVKLQIIPPLDSIRFIVTPRVLPPLADVALRLDSSLRASDVPLPALEAAAAEALAQAKSGSSSGAGAASTPSSVDAYMALRAELKSLCSQDVAVSFSGAELGRVEVIVKAAKASDAPFLSGLEGSAANGEGLGIDAFRPPKPVFSASKKLNIELETLDAMRAAAQGGGASPDGISTSAPSSSSTSSSSKSLDLGAGRTQFREWTERDVEEGFVRAGELDELEPVADTLAAVLTSQYSKQQERAARKVGVSPGAAWRAALEAATAAGVQQFLLVDLPTNVTQRRLADGVLASVGGSLVGAAAMVATTAAVVAFTDLLPQPAEYACLALAATLAAGLVAPLIGPIQEISKLADKDPEQIEAAVSDHASLLQPSTAAASSSGVKAATRLPGEDALIDWPGALRPIVEERDSYMARALAAAAVPGRRGVSPAFVLDRADGQPVWRYMMAEGAPDAAAPAGLGDAAYAPLPGGAQRIVAVVGAVHVSGMAAAWAESLADSSVAGLLPTARAAASK